MTNLNAEFFKLIGWAKCIGLYMGWTTAEQGHGFWRQTLPNVAGSWDDFHKWVVPELMKLVSNEKHKNYIAHTLGLFMLQRKTPENALRWAMEEIKKEIKND